MDNKAHDFESMHQDKGPLLLKVIWSMSVLAWVTVLLRAFVRIRILRSTRWDDFSILVATGFSVLGASFIAVSENAGYGRHSASLKPHDAVTAFKYLIFSEATAILSLTFSKMSISIFLLYLLQGTSGKRKKAFLFLTMGLLLVTALISLILMFAQCQPVSKLWNPAISGTCKDSRLEADGVDLQGVTAALVDFTLAAFPIFFIKDLQLSTQKKVVLITLMSLGVLAGICAIARTIVLSSLTGRSDLTYDPIDASIWLIVETNISIMVANTPTLRPLTQYWRRTKEPRRASYMNRDTMLGKQRLSSNGHQNQHDYEKGLAPSTDNILPAAHTRTNVNQSDDGASLYELSDFLTSSER